jgi:CRISPR-associated protein Cas5d
VLKPVRWISVRRNEVASKASVSNAIAAMNRGHGDLGIYVDDDRQQRAGLFLRDVAYRIHGSMKPADDEAHANPAKHNEMFARRAEKGQCVNQPYLGCREFAARFRLIENSKDEPPPIDETRDLGWMLHDLDFTDPVDPKPRFFHAQLAGGVVDLEGAEVRG